MNSLRYKINDSLELYADSKNFLHVMVNDQHITYRENETLKKLFIFLEENRTIKEIQKFLKKNSIDISLSEIEQLLVDFQKENIVKIHFSNDDSESMYSRQIQFFNNFYNENGSIVQKKLSSKTIVILGLGGIGSWIATQLAMSGIKNLVIVDPDKVEISNLTRQNLYGIDDINKYKVDVIEKKLQLITTNINIIKFKKYIDSKETVKQIIKNTDFVISCIDKPSIEEVGILISEVCFDYKIPHIISGGYNGHQGFIGPTLIPGKTLCWRCISNEINEQYKDYKRIIKSKSIGTLGMFSSIIASIQSWECIQYLVDSEKETIMQGKKGEFNFSDLTIKIDDFSKIKKCPLCS